MSLNAGKIAERLNFCLFIIALEFGRIKNARIILINVALAAIIKGNESEMLPSSPPTIGPK